MKRLVVLGSLNEDLVVAGVPLPRPGETVAGGRFERHHGGKGGNAAVAAARALRGGPFDGRVAFIGAVGADDHGRGAVGALRDEGIDIDAVTVRPDAPTGVALIVVATDGENQIAVASGANARLEIAAVEGAVASLMREGGVLLANLEVPLGAIAAGARVARDLGATVVINPAPAAAPGSELASLIDLADILTPNEVELATLGGAASLRSARPSLRLAVTLGAEGVRLVGPGTHESSVPGHKADPVVDTTGAGDTFNGVLAAGLLEGLDWVDAARRAVAAAVLSVAVAGAREGMPLRSAIDAAATALRRTP